MKTMEDYQLDQQIHSFMDRKLKQFPDLQQVSSAKRDHVNLLTRVQDFVAIWPHSVHPRHSH